MSKPTSIHPQEYSIALWKAGTCIFNACLAWGKVRSERGAAKAGAILARHKGFLVVGEKWEIDVAPDASFDNSTFKGITK